MTSRLINVRLDADRLRKARVLRERGVPLSDVVRGAIDERYSALHQAGLDTDVKGLIKRIFEEAPDPPGLPARQYEVHDRKAASAAIRRRLQTRKP